MQDFRVRCSPAAVFARLTRAKEQHLDVIPATALVATRATAVLIRPCQSHSHWKSFKEGGFGKGPFPAPRQQQLFNRISNEWNLAARKLPKQPRSGFRSRLTTAQARHGPC